MIDFASLYDSNTGQEDLDLSNSLDVDGVGVFSATFVGVARGVSSTSAILAGKLEYSMPTVCDRCFAGFTHCSSVELEVYVSFEAGGGFSESMFEAGTEEHYGYGSGSGSGSGEGDVDVDDTDGLAGEDNNDSEYYIVDSEEFDPWDIIGEELMLNLPYRYVCSPDCASVGDYVSGDDSGFGKEDVRTPFKNLGEALGKREDRDSSS